MASGTVIGNIRRFASASIAARAISKPDLFSRRYTYRISPRKIAVEIPRNRPSSSALRTRSAPVISSLGALVASGISTARNTFASRQARGGDSRLLIFPAFLEFLVRLAEVPGRQLRACQSEGFGQARG